MDVAVDRVVVTPVCMQTGGQRSRKKEAPEEDDTTPSRRAPNRTASII